MPNLIYLLLVFSSPNFVRTQEKTCPPGITTNKVWVFFTDKCIYTQSQYQTALVQLEQNLIPAQRERRQKAQINGFDFDDLPVTDDYIRQIEAMGARLRIVSRWLNAASFDIHPEMVPRVYWLPFVYSIKPVATRSKTDLLDVTVPIKQPETARILRRIDSADAHRFYGATWDQAQMLGVPEIFYQGWFGSGVRLALFDTGLKLKHTAVKNLRITKQYDFISGDNFYIARGNSIPEPIDNLRYLGLIKDPALSLNGNNAILAFIADSFSYSYNLPVRALFYSFSTDRGANWSSPTPVVISRPYYHTYENLCMSVKDSVTYLAFNEVDLHQGASPTCYLGYFINTEWKSCLTIGTGKEPSLANFLDTLYIAYLKKDSTIVLRKAVITQPAPNWLFFTELNLTEPITAPQITAGPDREVNIYACAKNSGKIIHLHSDDGGENFIPQPDIVSNRAHMPKLFSHPSVDSIKFLIYQDKLILPYTKLKLARSFDWGKNWDTGYTLDSTLTISNYTLGLNSKITIIYESAGLLHQLSSADSGRTWQANGIIDTTGFCYSPNLTPDNSFCIWFRRGDDNVLWEESDTFKFSREQPNHGTRMASIIAGYQPYSLMGIAPGVDLIVAKTEFYKTSSSRAYEYNMEEDTYIQALEWAERCGADVVSTSLGYRGWYQDEEFDGKTAPISIAADLAAKRGMLIVTAMGNRDTTAYPWPKPYIVAPGDAEGVVTCGGVEKNLLPWRGTGTGPTADGRIKPDLVALSDTVAVVAPDSENFLEGSVGTSCATALIAGCCALLKEAHPNWSADSIKSALFSTATFAVKSCTFGFGVPRVDSAFKLFPPVSQPVPRDQIALIYPNPFIPAEHDTVYFAINFHRPTPKASITIYTVSGIKVKTIELNCDSLSLGRYKNVKSLVKLGAFWDGTNENNKPVSSGLYLAVLNTTFGKSVAKFALVR